MISIARTLGAPETVPAGKPAASASRASWRGSGLPSPFGGRGPTRWSGSTENWAGTTPRPSVWTRPRRHHLDDVAGGAVLLRLRHHGAVLLRRRVRGGGDIERRCEVGRGLLGERPVERIDPRGEPLDGAAERTLCGDAGGRPHRSDE